MIQHFHFWVYNQKKWKQKTQTDYLHTHVHRSIICNSIKVEATQYSETNEQINCSLYIQENVIQP